MAALPIHTALNVPTVSSYPSVNCLQWSGDGQAYFVSKSAVYILTPDPGINFDTSSVLKAPVSKDNGNDKPLGWFRTMIACNSQNPPEKPQSWPEVSQEWGAVALGSLDISVKSATCSPSNLTANGRCILASLNSNLEVSLWAATNNHLKGEWMKIQDVTAFLSQHFLLPEKRASLEAVLQVQITSLAWSVRPDFGFAPAPCLDGSILVTGNRAGCVILLRYQTLPSTTDHIHHLETIKVSEKWITSLAWSPWMRMGLGKCKSFLAVGSSDGRIDVIEIAQFLRSVPTSSGFSTDYVVELSHSVHDQIPAYADGCGITGMTWIEMHGKNPILVYCKPGMVYLWSIPVNPLAASVFWSGSRAMHLQTQITSAGSSSISPVSGIHYIRSEDTLILSLFDGTFHAIHGLTIDPSYFPPNTSSTLTSQNLSATARLIFSRAEMRDTPKTDINRISGMMSYDGLSTVVWAHEACRPTDFSYKHEAKHSCMLVVTQLWDETREQNIPHHLAEILISAKSASEDAPIHVLRPVFLHLGKRKRLSQDLPAILNILQQPSTDDSVNVILSPWNAGDQSPELMLDFRRSLTTHLFGWDNLFSLRMKLSVADLCWKLSSENPQAQAECGQTAQYLLTTIAHWVLRTIIRHIASVMAIITSNDIPFVLRIVVQGLLPGLPTDLSIEAQELSNSLNTVVPEINQTATSLVETCPACHVEVPLVDITSALCSNGHAWARCSVTSFILSTPMVRTCIGCSRKAFLPLSQKPPERANWLPAAARSWLVEQLLEAVHHCLFCGNSFVTIL